jgi:integrase
MAIKRFYSKREKKHWKYDAKKHQYWSWGYDIYLADGRRKREHGFMTESDAVAAVGKIRKDEKDRAYGYVSVSDVPLVTDLVERRKESITDPREKSRSTRILGDLLSVLDPSLKVTELKTAHVELFVKKRLADGLKPQSVDRELNSVAACLNSVKRLYPQLDQWVHPEIPRPKAPKGRRERLITGEEKKTLHAYLLAPRRFDERSRNVAEARRRVGLKLQFALLSGMRHGEMNKLKKEHIDWDGMRLKVLGTKTQYVANPTRYVRVTKTMAAILREFIASGETDFVFTRSGHESPKFYEILRRACEDCSIPYGREVADGLTFHDARHTATTRMLQAGLDLATIQSVTGHSDKSMVLYYSHATPETSARASDVLEAYAGDESLAEQAEKSELTGEQLEQLMTMYEGKKIDRARLYRVLQGAEPFPSDLLEEEPVE